MYYNLYDQYITNIKCIKALIYSLYLISWLYILTVSFHTVPVDTLDVIWNILDIEEPFSGIYLNEYLALNKVYSIFIDSKNHPNKLNCVEGFLYFIDIIHLILHIYRY